MDFSKGEIKRFLHSGSNTATAANIVIAVVAVGAVVGVAAIAPAIFTAVGQFSGKKLTKRQTINTYYSLKRRGFIKTKDDAGGKKKVVLTKKGEKRLETIVLNEIKIPAQNSWDRKWRFVVFDIPKEKARVRDEFRFKLMDLGFEQYQWSVWVYPYPCEEQIRDIATFFTIWKHVDVLEVNTFSGEGEMRNVFRKECNL